MTDVELSPSRLKWLLEVANERSKHKDPLCSRKKDPGFTDLELDFIGVKGEYVVSHVYGVPFDTRGYGRRGDRGVDIYTPTPGAIKANHRRGGYLLLERWRDIKHAEIMHLVDGRCRPPRRCLCVGGPSFATEIWRYVGWMTTEAFRRQSLKANWGRGPRRYCESWQVERQRLHAVT